MEVKLKKIAVVTGASQGIGECMAEELAAKGYSLIIAARNLSLLEKLKIRLTQKYNVDIYCLKADLSIEEGVQSLLDFCQPHLPTIEVFINNAGFGEVKSLVEQKWSVCREMIELNITSLTKFTHFFGDVFKSKKSGYILNVASTAAFQPDPYFAVYGASKSYVLNFSEAVREELLEFNVYVSVLCPGMTETGFHERAGSRNIKAAKMTMLPVGLVAKTGIDGLFAKKAVIIPGFLNRYIVASLKLVPRSVVVKMAKKLMSKN